MVFTSFCAVGLWHTGVQMGNLAFKYSGEGKIFGRLVESRAHGVFSQAGLLGWVIEPGDMRSFSQMPFGQRMHEIKIGEFQARKLYMEVTGKYRYEAYQSQTGLQAVIYYYLDKIYHDPLILRVSCVSFLAIVLVCWLNFVWCSFGIWPAFVSALGILSSPFLSETGDNVAHVVGAHYLVLVVMFWAYHKRIARLAAVAFSVVLLKLLLNGPEFLFDVLLLPFVSLVYYAILRQMPWSKIRHDACQLAIGVIAASVVAFSVVALQIIIVTQSLQAPFAHFVERSSSEHL